MAARQGATSILLSAALGLLGGSAPVSAQSGSQTQSPAVTPAATPHQIDDRVRRHIDELRMRPEGNRLPPADSFTVGPRQIPASATLAGPIAVAQGSVDVSGHVNGDVFVVDGDAVVHRGAVVTGDVVSIGGRVTMDGGRVDGEIRMLSAPSGATVSSGERPPLTTWQSIKLVMGWFAVLVIIGLGVMIFAEPNMDGVVQGMERSFARAFWFGVLGEIMALPALLLICLGLVLTILGVLLIPFAIVAYGIAVAGLLTLGFLAVARMVGGSVKRDGNATPRARALTALAIGVAVFFVLWMVAALLTWSPLAATVVRAAALAMTWVAVTLGFGAALLSRAGTHRRVAAGVRPVELASWQTPTPLTGVVAARRPKVTEAS